jgi:hypothetical protein
MFSKSIPASFVRISKNNDEEYCASRRDGIFGNRGRPARASSARLGRFLLISLMGSSVCVPVHRLRAKAKNRDR